MFSGFNYDIMPVRINAIKQNPKLTIDNVDLRMALEQAVEDAQLNVTERYALNKTFYPNGGGFNIFPKNGEYKYNLYKVNNRPVYEDSFNKEVEAIDIPDDAFEVKKHFYCSLKDSYTLNLENAIKKLNNLHIDYYV